MKKWSLSLMSILFLFPAFAEVEGQKLDEKIFVRPFVEKISKEIATAAHNSNLESIACTTGCGELPALVAINIGCNVPTSGHIFSEQGCTSISLNAYIKQIADSLAINGNAVITTPASYDVVFTDGSRSDEEIYAHMEEILAKIDVSKDCALIKEGLSQLRGVNRATFVRREDKLTLVTDVRALRLGESIWRITPRGVELDAYHSEEEYLVAFKNANLVCEEIARPSFFGEIKWKMYNDSLQDKKDSLGAAYIEHNPFTIYHVKKNS